MKMMILIRYLLIRRAYRENHRLCITDYDYNKTVFVNLSTNLKLSIDIFIMSVIYISIDFI